MRLKSHKQEEGSTLVLTLILSLTICTVLASYLTLLGSRYKITLRSQCWNAAIPVLEAGIEEAMSHLHKDRGNPAANDWTPTTINGETVYSKQRTIANGSYFLVNIFNAGTNNPYIYSTGFVPAPMDPGKYISRTVKVMGSTPPLISFAFASINAIRMNGTGMGADSFNSNDPSFSTNGQYDQTKASTNGDVASVNGPVNFGNHTIAGDLFLGPAATNSSVPAGQVLGEIHTDFNVSFPDAELPDTAWSAATTTVIAGVTTYRFTSSGDYSINASYNIQVDPGVTVRVRVDATSFNPAGIHILSTNGNSGNLAVYQVAGSATIGGNLVVDSGRARNFYYYGLPGVTSITYGGTSDFVGVIYAPEAAFTLNGGGNNIGIIGSSVTKSITMNGHYNFHFDEDLMTSGPTRSFVATSWQEM